MKYRQLLTKTTKSALAKEKEESAIIWLIGEVFGFSNSGLYANLEMEVDESKLPTFYEKLALYLDKNIPVQYIVGYDIFYGYSLFVNEDVLIPRFETEELVQNIFNLYDELFIDTKVEVADIGTGSGCIGLTLAKEEPNMQVTITDISFKALEVARKNAKNLDVSVQIKQGDMLEPVRGQKFDILVSNPPYIPENEYVESLVKDNEPNVALFGGIDGLKFYEIILSQAKEYLKEKNFIAFEHAFDKAMDIKKLAFKYFPLAEVYCLKDLQKKDRMTFIINRGQ